MKRTAFFALAVAASAATAQDAARPDPRDPAAKVPPAAYGSAFEGYRPFADQALGDWRKANEEVGAAGGHAGMRPGQGAGQASSKPQPGKPQSQGGAAEKHHGMHK